MNAPLPRRSFRSGVFTLLAVAACVLALGEGAGGQEAPLQYADQGANWTPATRAAYYVQDQGSQMIPLAWIKALKQPDGKPFLADRLARYGFLPNPKNPEHLPVGFSLAESDLGKMTGLTCSACHTRELTAQGKTYRIDGGPAFLDFQAFLGDLDKAVLEVLASEAAFTAFANAVLGSPTPAGAQVAILRGQVTIWSLRYHTLMSGALPKHRPWGPARLDAVSMIFNRLSGLDLGPAENFYMIPSNIRPADAPARYPFLWNAPIQDLTQWPGFALNGSDTLALARNLGEVYGVFGTFRPLEATWPFNRDYNKVNSANFVGLLSLEWLVRQIGPPKWPSGWPRNTTLAKTAGKDIFDKRCGGCHGQKAGPIRINLDGSPSPTWVTPVEDVKTDIREWSVLTRTADAGSLTGATLGETVICKVDAAVNLLTVAVQGSLRSRLASSPLAPPSPDPSACSRPPQAKQAGHPYEARVLYGVWAAAPYLHNGSVPTLAELLKPPPQRVKSFKVGPAYDPKTLGLAVDQPRSNFTLVTTDCNDLASGNSNCGHDYGTNLSDSDKAALLEYLKVIGEPQ